MMLIRQHTEEARYLFFFCSGKIGMSCRMFSVSTVILNTHIKCLGQCL